MKAEKLQQIAHMVAGFILLVQGFNWFNDGISLSVSIYLVLACIFLLVAGMRKWVQRKFTGGDVAFFLFEAAALFYAAVSNHDVGKTIIWIILATTGIFYIGFAIATFINNMDKSTRRKRRRSRRRRRYATSAS